VQVVRLEYGFQEKAHITVETRKALAFYVIRRWRLNEAQARLELEKIEEMDGQRNIAKLREGQDP
jgi:hypothetical protein